MLLDEFQRRRGGFREGRRVVLADGEAWTFPDPSHFRLPGGGRAESVRYQGLIQALVEADDAYDRGPAEVAFSTFLLRSNYDLEPEEIQRLLRFPAGSAAESAWRGSQAQLAADHLGAFVAFPEAESTIFQREPEVVERRGLFGWLRRWRPLLSARR